jgi:hypothetical protein
LLVLTGIHLLSELAPLAAWQFDLGHAGIPSLLVEAPGHLGSTAVECPINGSGAGARRAAAVLGAKPHGAAAMVSTLSGILENCGSARSIKISDRRGFSRSTISARCPLGCEFRTSIDEPSRVNLLDRVVLARILDASPLLELRHHSPAAHALKFPSRLDIEDALEITLKECASQFERSTEHPLADRINKILKVDGSDVPSRISQLMQAIANVRYEPFALVDELHDELLNGIADGVMSDVALPGAP